MRLWAFGLIAPDERQNRKVKVPGAAMDEFLYLPGVLASDIGLCTERRLYQSLCLPAGVPSDQSATGTKNTRIGGSPFIWDGSCDEKNQ